MEAEPRWIVQRMLLFVAMALTWVGAARAEEPETTSSGEELRYVDPFDQSGDYRSIRAGEGFRTSIFGFDVEEDARDRRSTSAMDLGADAYFGGPDEAQLIPTKATFDEIRLLTNFQLDDQNLLSVVLIGQPELENRLEREAYAPLRQRIGMRYSLGPLSLEETVRYIDHRIRVAGGSRNPFTAEAMNEIHALSRGIPRLINTLATTSLLDAFGEDAETIETARVASAAQEHRIHG